MVILSSLSIPVGRGTSVAAPVAVVPMRVRSTSTATTVMPAVIGPPARFWSLVLSDAKHHGLLFKKDK